MADLEMIDAFVGISQVKARYCRTLDTKDWDAFADLFTEDFTLDVPEVDTIHGRDDAVAFIRASVGEARTAHQIHLPEIDLDGDEARVIWAMQDRNTWDPPRNGISTLRGYGQYHERYVRVNGTWKIAAQRLVYLQLDLNQA
jgi:3-phenylpropionate/cinnamic acid dioxygenase small subunit